MVSFVRSKERILQARTPTRHHVLRQPSAHRIAHRQQVDKGVHNHEWPKLKKLQRAARMGVLVVKHQVRLTRFGYDYIATLLAHQGRPVDAIFPTNIGDDLVNDFVAVITSMAACIYGRRKAKRRAAQIQACV